MATFQHHGVLITDHIASTASSSSAGPHSPTMENETPVLSKNAQKKILKAQRNEELKKIKRQRERERKKSKREEAKKQGTYVPINKHKIRPAESVPVNASIVIDLGFDDLMTEKEITSITSQITLVYSANKMALRPFQSLILCGQGTLPPTELLSTDLGKDFDQQHAKAPELTLYDSKIGQRMRDRMLGSWERWQDVQLRNEGGLECLYKRDDTIEQSKNSPICSLEQVVYLTADTETTLDTIKEGEMYVIGGLVDRNRYKDICAEKARRLGLRTARLPISADRLKSSVVMTVNQVVNILLAFNQTGSWEEAFDQHLPKRKMRKENEQEDIQDQIDEKKVDCEGNRSDLERGEKSC